MGHKGYKVVTAEELKDAIFYHDYDFSIYFDDISNSGKTVKLFEYSHDVPTGAALYITGLTNTELKRIENAKSFDFVDNFITQKASEINKNKKVEV